MIKIAAKTPENNKQNSYKDIINRGKDEFLNQSGLIL